MIRLRRFFALFAVVLAVLTHAFAARADDPAKLKADADATMDAHRYAEAAQLYGRLYEVTSDPTALYNEGRALEALGEYPDAIDRLERFRDAASPALRARTKGLDEHIEELRGRVTTIVITTPARGARLLVRGKDSGAIEGSRELRVRAGPATIEVNADGYQTFKREIDLQARTTERIDVELKPRSTTPLSGKPQDDGEARPITGQWWFWVGMGVLVVGAASAVVIAVTSGGADEKTGDFDRGRIAAPLITF